MSRPWPDLEKPLMLTLVRGPGVMDANSFGEYPDISREEEAVDEAVWN